MKKKVLKIALMCFMAIFSINCAHRVAENQNNQKIMKILFGSTSDGQEVHLYTLTNKNNMQVSIINFGGVITSVLVPDIKGNMGDVVLGFDNLDDYMKENPYFGALVGRYGNRIANGKFTLNGKEYTLATNNGPNHLHGGIKGFDKVLWTVEENKSDEGASLKLTYLSKDGEEGYPGNLDVTVIYTLNDNNEIVMEYEAQTDSPTPINLTNHSYFNLNPKSKNALGHLLEIKADQYTVVNETLIPTGELRSVAGAMDFRKPKVIDKDLDSVDGGYDHNYVLNKTGTNLDLMATVHEPETGRFMEVFTTQPGVQFYSGNFLDGSLKGKNDKQYVKHYGFCLETQHFPDSPNQPDFPNTILLPSEKYNHTTIYRFSVK
ncbi:MAG: galactose mutarotase [Bacteroidota bacterium]|nr:galactose mutarotase [Bacteroidota bacterium]